MRICRNCRIEKPDTDFYSATVIYCKACKREFAKIYRQTNKTNNQNNLNKPERKICPGCFIDKLASEFYSDIANADGLYDRCIICTKKYRLKNRETTLVRQRKYNAKRAQAEKTIVNEKTCADCKQVKPSSEYYREKYSEDGLYYICKECKRKREKTDKRRETKRLWARNNRKERDPNVESWEKKKYKTDIVYKLRRNTSHAIIASIRKYSFSNDRIDRLRKFIFDHLPYTADQLKAHIESLWEPWMSWDNYGRYNKDKRTWQIDHIVAQSRLPFNSLEDENFRKLWDLGNLRPLDTVENIRKGNR